MPNKQLIRFYQELSTNAWPAKYYYLLNGRILTDENATMSDIINLKSNVNANINDMSLVRDSFSIIGYTTLENDIILFYLLGWVSNICT